jgi:hypothetical protein
MGGAEQADRKMAPIVNEVVEKLLIVGISDAGNNSLSRSLSNT